MNALFRHRALAAACCLALGLGLLGLPAPAAAQAGGFDEAQVAAAVETWVRHVPAAARPDATIAAMEPYQVDGETVAYIAYLAGGGFCLTGADPAVLPVYFYSPQGTYRADNPDYQVMLSEIAARTAAGRQALTEKEGASAALATALAGRATDWAALIAGSVPAQVATPASPQAEPSYLLLPVDVHWHQGAPYFDQLPELTPGANEHTVVGCNATATVQIMYYWQWPPGGTGSHCVSYPYRWRSNWDATGLSTNVTIPPGFSGRLQYNATTQQLQMNGYWDDSVYSAAQQISGDAGYLSALAYLWGRMNQSSKLPCANFGSATYNWSIMQPTNAEPPDAAGNEAAKVSAHVSIGVDSGLGAWGTGSSFGNDSTALRDYFRYDPSVLFTDSVPRGAGADIYSLTAEIRWGRPAGLGGSSPAGGHAWVIDGYDKSTDPNRLFHMNLGWGGGSDGWYTFDSAPFPQNHDMLTRIAPLDVVKFVAAATAAGNGSPDQPYPGIQAAATSAPSGSTLMLQAGTEYNFTGSLVIDRPLTLKGYGATIR